MVKKIIFISSLFFLILGVNTSLCIGQEKGRIVGKTIIYGEVKGVDLTNESIMVRDIITGATRTFPIDKIRELQGYGSLREVKAGDYVELEVTTSIEGKQTLLSIKHLKTEPDFTDKPDLSVQGGGKESSEEIKKIWQEIEIIKDRLQRLERR